MATLLGIHGSVTHPGRLYHALEYALNHAGEQDKGVLPYVKAAQKAQELGLGINAGHDLSLENIEFFASKVPGLDEVSIGHALISESLYMGFEIVINMYLNKIKRGVSSWK